MDGLTEYGNALADIGRTISELSKRNNTGSRLAQQIENNLRICQENFQKLIKIKVPTFLLNKHNNLTKTFEHLILAFMLQKYNLNNQGEVSKKLTFFCTW